MKTTHLKTQIVLLLSLAFIGSASTSFASDCTTAPVNGIFRNANSDRFEISSDCNHLRITDVQLGQTYDAQTGSFQLQPQPFPTNHLIGTLGRVFPFSIRLGEMMGTSRDVFIRFRLPLKQDQSNQLVAPGFEVRMTMWWNPYGRGEFNFWFQSIHATHQPGASEVQTAFEKGINLGLELLSQYARPHFNESLRKVNE